MEYQKGDITAGAFVALALAVFAALFVFMNRHRLASKTYHVQIRLQNIGGIDKGTEVIYKGYKAGEVDRIAVTYEPEFHFDVRLAIRKEILLKRGTAVVVKGKGLGAVKFLELAPPPPGETGEALERGALLPVVLEADLMARANEVMGDIKNLIGHIDKSGTAASLQDIVLHGKSAAANLDGALLSLKLMLEENRAALRKTLAELQGIGESSRRLLSESERSIQKTVENLEKASSHLPAILGNTEALTDELRRRPWRLIRKGGPEIPAPAKEKAPETPAEE